MTKAIVLGRAWIFDGDHPQIEVWEHEFEPTDDSRFRSGALWAKEHLCETYTDDDLREMFNLPKEGNFQVLFKGTLSGYKVYSLEGDDWNEEFDVEESQFQPIGEEYMECLKQANEETKREQR